MLSRKKKAQGISLNVIIIAAIALLVLVILSVVFLGRTRNFTETVADCRSANGQVVAESNCDTGSGKNAILTQYNVDDPDTTQREVCCVSVGG